MQMTALTSESPHSTDPHAASPSNSSHVDPHKLWNSQFLFVQDASRFRAQGPPNLSTSMTCCQFSILYQHTMRINIEGLLLLKSVHRTAIIRQVVCRLLLHSCKQWAILDDIQNRMLRTGLQSGNCGLRGGRTVVSRSLVRGQDATISCAAAPEPRYAIRVDSAYNLLQSEKPGKE